MFRAFEIICDRYDTDDYISETIINFIDRLYQHKNHFNTLVEELIAQEHYHLSRLFLIYAAFSDISLEDESIIKMLHASFKSNEMSLISRAITTLEINNNKEFNQQFKGYHFEQFYYTNERYNKLFD